MTENKTETNEAEEEMADTRKGRIGRGFATIELISRLVLAVMTRFWKLCSTALLIILLVFWFEGGLFASFLLLIAVLGLFYNAQDMLLYHPNQPPHSRLYVELPGILHLPYENHFVKTRDGTQINLVLVKQQEMDAPTIIFFHGNAGNIGHRLMNILGLYSACKCNILMVEYRGYGKSEGSPSEYGYMVYLTPFRYFGKQGDFHQNWEELGIFMIIKVERSQSGLYEDAEAAADFILKRSDVNRRKVFIFGRSLGGAVAINLASKPYYGSIVAGLIVENTFTSLPDIAKVLFSFKIVDYLPSWCFKNQYPSQRRLESLRLPILFLSGQGDQLIPPRMMTSLYDASCSSLKRISRFPNGSHNETWMCSGYYEAWLKFIQEACVLQPQDRELSVSLHIDNGIKDV